MAHEMTSPSATAGTARPRPAITGRMGGRMRSDTFERLFEEHGSRLFSFLVYRTGDRALAEDLLSETSDRVLRSRPRSAPRRASERCWLYPIAVKLLRDHARRQVHEDRILQHVGAGSPQELP